MGVVAGERNCPRIIQNCLRVENQQMISGFYLTRKSTRLTQDLSQSERSTILTHSCPRVIQDLSQG